MTVARLGLGLLGLVGGGATSAQTAAPPADTGDIQVATLSYGLGNWYLVTLGDTVHAREAFQRSIQSGGWPAFGFIVSEIELRRLR